MNLINKRGLQMTLEFKAKNQAYNDMLKDDARQRKAKSNRLKSLNADAIAEADIYRFIFGDEFVDSNNTIIKQNKERVN